MRIIASRSLRTLAARLADELEANPLPPVEEETIIVPSPVVRRWVTLMLADRLGCAASLRTPQPAAFCNQLAEAALGEAGGATRFEWPFGREALTWRILAQLSDETLDDRRFAEVRAYLADRDPVKRYLLARRLARCFDDYQTYRPEMLQAWEQGAPQAERRRGAAWQAELWRRLRAATEASPLPNRLERLHAALADRAPGEEPPVWAPKRAAVFGVSALAPAFLSLLVALSRVIPVSLYVRAAGRWEEADDSEPPAAAWRRAMGKREQEFMSLLADLKAEWEWLDAEERDETTLLGAVQRGAAVERPDDDSLTVHVCHSPRREMEVLRDWLLDAFDRDPELTPQEVLVLAPNMNAYAPYVHAVFQAANAPALRLPYSVTSDGDSTEPMTAALLRALELADSRFKSADVLALLDCPAARRAAGLTEAHLPTVRRWVRAARIRWGIDGKRRAENSPMPPVEANTWRAGLDRLLMGYATGPLEEVVAGVAPCAGPTLDEAELLGRFAAWTDRLFKWLEELQRPRPLTDWAERLRRLTGELFAPGDEDEEAAAQAVRDRLAQLEQTARAAEYDAPVELAVVREHLKSMGAATRAEAGVGCRILFAELAPMQTIPARVVAVCGLSHENFPRRHRPPAFDLQAAAPRPGDPQAREEDRQAFLEAIMTPERRLFLSYVGRSEKDNAPRAASVCLSELLDALGDAARGVTVAHRAQPFSPAYFDGTDPRLFSYSQANCPRPTGERLEREPPFAPRPLDVGEKTQTLTLSELIQFWLNPSRWFCVRGLKLWFREDEDALETDEPHGIEDLLAYHARQTLLQAKLRGQDAEPTLRRLAAAGELPPARLGEAAGRALATEAEDFLTILGDTAFLDPVAFALEGDGWTLFGQVDGLTKEGRLAFRFARIKPKDRIRAWLTHLALNAWVEMTGADAPRVTRLIGSDREERLEPTPNARERLEELINGLWAGETLPLPFFPNASWEYAACLRKQGRNEAALERAARKWREDEYAFDADSADPYIALCFRGRDPFAAQQAEFIQWADTFWTPYFACTEKGRKR